MRHGINAFATGVSAISPFPSKAAKAGNIQQITNITNNRIINLIMNSFPHNIRPAFIYFIILSLLFLQIHFLFTIDMEPVFQKVSTNSKNRQKKYSRKIREHNSYIYFFNSLQGMYNVPGKTTAGIIKSLYQWQFLIGNVKR